MQWGSLITPLPLPLSLQTTMTSHISMKWVQRQERMSQSLLRPSSETSIEKSVYLQTHNMAETNFLLVCLQAQGTLVKSTETPTSTNTKKSCCWCCYPFYFVHCFSFRNKIFAPQSSRMRCARALRFGGVWGVGGMHVKVYLLVVECDVVHGDYLFFPVGRFPDPPWPVRTPPYRGAALLLP